MSRVNSISTGRASTMMLASAIVLSSPVSSANRPLGPPSGVYKPRTASSGPWRPSWTVTGALIDTATVLGAELAD